MQNLRILIKNITRALDMIKGFTTGHSSSDDNHIIIWYEDKAYKVTFEEVENDIEDPIKVIKRELK